MIRRTLLAALLAVLLSAGRLQAQEPASLDEYVQATQTASSLLLNATGAAPATSAASISEAADVLAAITIVRMPEGTTWPVDNHVLVSDLRSAAKTTPSRQQIQNLVERVQALRSAMLAPPAAADAAQRAKLSDVLNNPPFKTGDNLWTRVVVTLFDWLDRILGRTAGGIADRRELVVALGLLLAAAVVGTFAYTLRQNLAPDARMDSAEAPAPTAAAALAQAQQSADRGDYRLAARSLYLAALLLLDERGIIRYDRTLTNRENLAAVTAANPARAALEPIVATFDRVWYGYQPMSRDEFDAYHRQVDDLRHLE